MTGPGAEFDRNAARGHDKQTRAEFYMALYRAETDPYAKLDIAFRFQMEVFDGLSREDQEKLADEMEALVDAKIQQVIDRWADE